MTPSRPAPLVVAIAAAIGWAGTAQAQAAAAPSASGPRTVRQVVEDATAGITFESNETLQARQKANPALLLIDVRSLVEFEAGHIPGATWIDGGLVAFKVTQAVRDADREIFVTCASRNRTGQVVKALRELGYRNVHAHVGFNAWVDAGNAFENFLGQARMTQRRQLQLSAPFSTHFDQPPVAEPQP